MLEFVRVVALVMIALGSERLPAQILAELDALSVPSFDGSGGNAGFEKFRIAQTRVAAQRADLIGELFVLQQDHERLASLLPERWDALSRTAPARVVDETDRILTRKPAPPYADAAAFSHAFATMAMLGEAEPPATPRIAAAVDRFVERCPSDVKAAAALANKASSLLPRAPDQLEVYRRLRRAHTTGELAQSLDGLVRQAEAVGKPFELGFADALTGRSLTMNDFRGKVVVVDFWATWCAPCRGELPSLKALYEKHHERGLEVIGVSLDDETSGGLDGLRRFATSAGLTWPQCYQGHSFDGEISRRWGIGAIPRIFLVDRDGILRSVSARGRLDSLVPSLLAETTR